MGYESFKNPLAAKIAQNARNLGFEQLMNEEFVQMLLSSKKMELSAVDRENIEQKPKEYRFNFKRPLIILRKAVKRSATNR